MLLLGKTIGHKMTLPVFLKSYTKDKKLKAEYNACDKKALLKDFKDAKEAKVYVPTRQANATVSKAVTRKMKFIMTHVCLYYFLDTSLTIF